MQTLKSMAPDYVTCFQFINLSNTSGYSSKQLSKFPELWSQIWLKHNLIPDMWFANTLKKNWLLLFTFNDHWDIKTPGLETSLEADFQVRKTCKTFQWCNIKVATVHVSQTVLYEWLKCFWNYLSASEYETLFEICFVYIGYLHTLQMFWCCSSMGLGGVRYIATRNHKTHTQIHQHAWHKLTHTEAQSHKRTSWNFSLRYFTTTFSLFLLYVFNGAHWIMGYK